MSTTPDHPHDPPEGGYPPPPPPGSTSSSGSAASPGDHAGPSSPAPHDPARGGSTAMPAADAGPRSDAPATPPPGYGHGTPPPYGQTPPPPYGQTPPPGYGQGTPPPYGQGTPPPYGQGAYGQGTPPPGYGPGGSGHGTPPAGYGPTGYGHGAPGAYPPPAYGAPLSPSDQRTWAVLSHVLTLLLAFLAPLIVWLVFKGRGAFSEDHAKESLNFQITMLLVTIGLSIATGLTFGLAGLLFFPFLVFVVVFVLIASIKAGQGEPYRYPLTYRFIR